jgi:RNA polymerase sigma factor (sigma-70 family)
VARSHRQDTISLPIADDEGRRDDPAAGVDPLAVTVIAAQAGEEAAIRRFLEGIASTVRRTCRAVLGADHPDLDDTMQESLLASIKALPQYRHDGDIRHYVARITLRLAIVARRRRATHWRQHNPLDMNQAAPGASASGEGWSNEELDLVWRILDTLTSVQSEALLMRVVFGFSVEEIAAKTGVSPNTVKTRLRLGKNALRRGAGLRFWQRWLGGNRTVGAERTK